MKIGRINFTVKIGEAYMYLNRRRIRRKLVGQSYWIVADICQETDEVFYDITICRNSNYLTHFIKRNVVTGT